MSPSRARPWRYQLSKKAVTVLERGHPWIFRGLVSSATGALPDGQWLALHDGNNRVVGHGIYAAEGAVAIRVLTRGPDRPRGPALAARVDAALARRAGLRAETAGFRAIHGESDGLPAVVVDVFGPVVVAQSYAAGTDALARFAGRRVARALDAGALILRAGHRRVGVTAPPPPRVVRGQVADDVGFREGPLILHARPLSGQKSGSFLDLRGLRRFLVSAPLLGARVLNLFAYTGGLGLACELAGAASITQVDRSADALALARAQHVRDPARHRLVVADAFGWRPPAGERFDLVIVDPPSMTSRKEQVPQVLAAYRRLHHHAAGLVAPGGQLILCCCTSRVTRGQFAEIVAERHDRFAPVADLPPEPDHPVGFPEADYLKIRVLRARS